MSSEQLRRAARFALPAAIDDIETRIILMLVADRADANGVAAGSATLTDELAAELDAALARLDGDPLPRAGVDNARVTRVVAAFQEARGA